MKQKFLLEFEKKNKIIFLGLYHLWNSIYFGCHVIISVSNQILHLMSMQAAVTDMYPNFYKFRMYVFGVICVLCCFSGLCLLPSVRTNIILKSRFSNENINVTTICLIMRYIFSVLNLDYRNRGLSSTDSGCVK